MLGNLGQMWYSVPRGRMARLRACVRAVTAGRISALLVRKMSLERSRDLAVHSPMPLRLAGRRYVAPGAERWCFSKVVRQPRSRRRKAIRLAARPST